MWEAESIDQVHAIIKRYGTDAQIVFEMILAAQYDDEITTLDDVFTAASICERFRLGPKQG